MTLDEVGIQTHDVLGVDNGSQDPDGNHLYFRSLPV